MTEGSLAPTLLLAMPQMQDPNFARSVVLLCRHESEGAMGLIVNRPTGTRVSEVVDFGTPPQRDNGLQIWEGGPVDRRRGWLLLGYDPRSEEALRVSEQIYVSGSLDVLRHAVESDPDAAHVSRFLLGYAGWGGGQLESELAASAWLTVEVSHGLVFDTAPEHMWEAAIRSLGIDPYSLQIGRGVH
jgi:putative transcriptional regulator